MINKIIDVKPRITSIANITPQIKTVENETTVYLENRNIRAGEPMGLLLCITYPQAITGFTASRL